MSRDNATGAVLPSQQKSPARRSIDRRPSRHRNRGSVLRFMPAEFSAITLYLSADDVAALELRANSTDVVAFVTAFIRGELLGQPTGGLATCRRGGMESRTFHFPRNVLRRIEDGQPPGTLSGLVSELLAAHLKGGGQ